MSLKYNHCNIYMTLNGANEPGIFCKLEIGHTGPHVFRMPECAIAEDTYFRPACVDGQSFENHVRGNYCINCRCNDYYSTVERKCRYCFRDMHYMCSSKECSCPTCYTLEQLKEAGRRP